jgi:hypothetical protein
MESPEESKSEYYKTTIELKRTHVESFRVMFPMQGSLKWFFERCLENFVMIHDAGELETQIQTAVYQAIDSMNGNKEEESNG